MFLVLVGKFLRVLREEEGFILASELSQRSRDIGIDYSGASNFVCAAGLLATRCISCVILLRNSSFVLDLLRAFADVGNWEFI